MAQPSSLNNAQIQAAIDALYTNIQSMISNNFPSGVQQADIKKVVFGLLQKVSTQIEQTSFTP